MYKAVFSCRIFSNQSLIKFEPTVYCEAGCKHVLLRYACGNWIKQHPIPDDAPSVSNFENLGQDLELALKGN